MALFIHTVMEYLIIGSVAIIGVPIFILVAFLRHAWQKRKEYKLANPDVKEYKWSKREPISIKFVENTQQK